MKKPRKGELFEIEITDLAFGAKGIARTDDFVWFINRALPGQNIVARAGRIKKAYGEARLMEVLSPAPDQIDPPCPYFGICGGCQMQHWKYEKQVEAKARQVKDILQRIGSIPDPPMLKAIGADNLYAYRNKMEFTFSDRRWLLQDDPMEKPVDFALGLHAPGCYDKVLDLDACLLQSEINNAILREVKQFTMESGLPPYNLRTHEGFWRFLILREGQQTGQYMVHLVTSGQFEPEGLDAVNHLCKLLTDQHPELFTFIHGISDNIGQVARSETERILHGPGHISEKIYGLEFEISPAAFFQTNTVQAEILFHFIVELADFKGTETVFDLYCGTGAIGLALADKVNQVIGVEVIESAVNDARRNAERNGIENATFVLADMKDALRDQPVIQELGVPDVLILDPPRGGTHPKTIEDVLNLKAPKVIYVSCNPPMLAKDLQSLSSAYTLKKVQPVDLFPHTKHIEVVALLELTSV